VPFQQRFAMVTQFQKSVYVVTLLLAALASAFLIAPSAQHRILFRKREKRNLLQVSNNLAIAGMGFLALAIVGALTLIADILYGAGPTIAISLGALSVFAILWYAIPLSRR
jgi:uncharacterized protein DUF6328